jgi:hypothetical protein
MTESTSFINFPDRPRQLKFTLSAVRQFREKAGLPLWKARLPDDEGVTHLLDSEVMTKIIWAGLLHLNPGFSLSKAEGLLESFMETHPDGGLKALYAAMAVAFQESGLFGLHTPKPVEEGGEAPPVVSPND